LGDASHAHQVLGWQARTQVEALAAEMVEADIARHRTRLAA
jgi:GDPmannose 4,6-dehydratase